jgi:thiol-disulfide isomerase/thioredoxin
MGIGSYRSWARALVASLLVASAACGGSPEASDLPQRPDFELSSLGGDLVTASAFDGSVVLIDFWATWCTPCVAQARTLEPLHRDFEGRGVEFLAISLGEDLQTVEAYVDRSPFPYTVLIDPMDTLSVEYEIYALPTVVIIDRNGHVAYQQTGLSDGEVLRRVLEETLAG